MDKTFKANNLLAVFKTLLEQEVSKVEVSSGNAKDICQQLNSMVESIESVIDTVLVPIAIEHEVHIDRGDYGCGRSLVLKDEHWSGKNAG